MDLDAAALPGGDGFIDVTDVFQNAGAGEISLFLSCRSL
jgi:hypothetical protein